MLEIPCPTSSQGGTDLAAATEHAASLRTELESCRQRLRNERAAWDQDRESLVGDVDRWRYKAEEYVESLGRWVVGLLGHWLLGCWVVWLTPPLP